MVNAFLFIGLDLTTRDALHEQWRGRRLGLRMAVLIATGGALSWILNASAGRIAVASCAAFTISAAADGLVYQALRKRQWWQKSTLSNIAGALVDSLLFPTLAFGIFLPLVTLGQFVAKILGGALWIWLLRRGLP